MKSISLIGAVDTPMPIWNGGKPMSILFSNASAGTFSITLSDYSSPPKTTTLTFAYNETAANMQSTINAALLAANIDNTVTIVGTNAASTTSLVFLWLNPIKFTIDGSAWTAVAKFFDHENMVEQSLRSRALIMCGQTTNHFFIGGPPGGLASAIFCDDEIANFGPHIFYCEPGDILYVTPAGGAAIGDATGVTPFKLTAPNLPVPTAV